MGVAAAVVVGGLHSGAAAAAAIVGGRMDAGAGWTVATPSNLLKKKLKSLALSTSPSMTWLFFLEQPVLFLIPFHTSLVLFCRSFPLVVQLGLLKSPLQLMVYMPELLVVSLPESLLFLVKVLVDVTGDPGFIVGEAAYSLYWYHSIPTEIYAVCENIHPPVSVYIRVVFL